MSQWLMINCPQWPQAIRDTEGAAKRNPWKKLLHFSVAVWLPLGYLACEPGVIQMSV